MIVFVLKGRVLVYSIPVPSAVSRPTTTKQVKIPPIAVPTSTVIVPITLAVINGNRTIAASSTGAASKNAVVGFLEAILKSFIAYPTVRPLNTSFKSLGASLFVLRCKLLNVPIVLRLTKLLIQIIQHKMLRIRLLHMMLL